MPSWLVLYFSFHRKHRKCFRNKWYRNITLRKFFGAKKKHVLTNIHLVLNMEYQIPSTKHPSIQHQAPSIVHKYKWRMRLQASFMLFFYFIVIFFFFVSSFPIQLLNKRFSAITRFVHVYLNYHWKLLFYQWMQQLQYSHIQQNFHFISFAHNSQNLEQIKS